MTTKMQTILFLGLHNEHKFSDTFFLVNKQVKNKTELKGF